MVTVLHSWLWKIFITLFVVTDWLLLTGLDEELSMKNYEDSFKVRKVNEVITLIGGVSG